MNIVTSGIDAIREVLEGHDTDKKLSLLFCLERYLDPYFGYDLPYKKDIIDLLEKVIVTTKEKEVIEDALNLLGDYADGPFRILEKGFSELPKESQPNALYVINMHRMWHIEKLMNEECLRIYNESSDEIRESEIGEKYHFCDDAVIICDSCITPNVKKYPDRDCYDLFMISKDKVEAAGIPSGGLPYLREPMSGPFFRRAEFYYGIDLDNMQCCLIYHLGTKWGRCMVYELMCNEREEYSLGTAKTIWVS